MVDELISDLRESHRLLYENSQSNSQLVLAKDKAENSLARYQSEKSNLQSLIEAGQRELNNKNNQIANYSTQLAVAQNQLNQNQKQITVRNHEYDALTKQLNALQIESNNKNNEINT